MYYPKQVPSFLKPLWKNLIFDIPNVENQVFLTFDDGPTPEITPWVLDTLAQHNAKATFFCLGKNVESHPEIYHQIIEGGHSVGNHSYSHPNGWKSNTSEYLADISKAERFIQSSLLRPPYGKFTRHQSLELSKKYKLIMWSLLTADFDANYTGEDCLSLVKKHCRSGSILVFHDSIKAEKNLRYCLPKALAYLSKKGFSFSAIQSNVLP